MLVVVSEDDDGDARQSTVNLPRVEARRPGLDHGQRRGSARTMRQQLLSILERYNVVVARRLKGHSDRCSALGIQGSMLSG